MRSTKQYGLIAGRNIKCLFMLNTLGNVKKSRYIRNTERIRSMQKINVYKVHDADALVHKIAELRSQGKHPFSMATLHQDANDFHGDPTYLIDASVGYSTRSLESIKPYLDQYKIIDVTG